MMMMMPEQRDNEAVVVLTIVQNARMVYSRAFVTTEIPQ
jgi:hypothetical protein